MMKKLFYFIFIIGLFSLSALSKEIYDNEKEFYIRYDRYNAIKDISYETKLEQLRKIVDNPEFYASEKYIDYEILFAEDLEKKGITNKKLMEKFIQNALHYNISLSGFRIKDPNFNIFFESNVIDNEKLREFYDELVDNDFKINDIKSMSYSQKKEIVINLKKMFDLTYHDDLPKQYVNNFLQAANSYFQNPYFKKNYFCSNTKDAEECYYSFRILFGNSGRGYQMLESNTIRSFLIEQLKNENMNPENLIYFASLVHFDKKPTEELIKAIENGEFSPVYSIYYQPLSKVLETLEARSKLVALLRDTTDLTDQEKSRIMLFHNYSVNEKAKIVEKILKGKEKNKAEAINKIFNAKQERDDIKDAFGAALRFPFSFFEMLESIP